MDAIQKEWGEYMSGAESYVYQKEIEWSVLTDGFTLPVKEQVVFGQIMGRYMSKGEKKPIHIILGGKTYDAMIRNNNIQEKWNHKTDILQIRYPRNGELAQALQLVFAKSYGYIKALREEREKGDRRRIILPENARDYLAVYTTEFDDTYIFEPILSEDIAAAASYVRETTEIQAENEMNFETADPKAGIQISEGVLKIRRLNRKIGDNLKVLYGYRCQICGKAIGEEYGAHICEAHHIDYFTHSLNNNAENQMIVCPNHHRIIHAENPIFNRAALRFSYPNGYTEQLRLNRHL